MSPPGGPHIHVPVCTLLDWDTAHFGVRIARLTDDSINADRLCDVNRWCREHEIACAYFFSEIADRVSLRTAEDSAFSLVDIRTTFDRSNSQKLEFNGHTRHAQIRTATSADVPELERIAALSHHDSRFYFDCHFDRMHCDLLYKRWIRLSCEGYADAVLVPQIGENVVGYVTCHLEPDGNGRIGLFALDGRVQGMGIGAALMQRALEWFSSNGTARITVATQARNIAAQRFYQRCGFLTRHLQLIWHKWYSGAGSDNSI